MIKAAILGATGYAGAELMRILSSHPEASIVYPASHSYAGKKFSDIYPGLRSVVDITRNEMVKQELLRVCLLFAAADTENMFDEEKMNKLSSMPELSVKLR